MENVLITGVSGLIGTALYEEFKDRYRVIGLDIKRPESLKDLEFYECDLTSDESVDETLKAMREKTEGRLASVIHLAAYYDFAGDPSPLYEKLTVQGSERLLKGLNRHFTVEQFIFSSTLLVMKPFESEDKVEHGGKLQENSELRAEWDYPKSKIEAENIIREEARNIPVVVLRIAGIYDEEGHSPPICQQMSRIYEKKLESHFYPAPTDRGQPFLHLDDLVKLVAKAIEKRKNLSPFEVFLAAEPELMTYEELQENMGLLLHGKEWATLRIPGFVAKAGAWVKDKVSSEEQFIKPWMIDIADDHYPVSIDKAKEKLDWQPDHRLKDTLPKIAQFLKKSPKEWYKENGINPPH